MRRTVPMVGVVLLVGIALVGCEEWTDSASPDSTLPGSIGSASQGLTGGSNVAVGQFEAVGRIYPIGLNKECSATLITDTDVLTAGHCVCPTDTGLTGCVARARFVLDDVFPADDPATAADESASRTTVTVDGDARVHPEYGQRGWLREDIAVVTLDQPMSQLAPTVAPIPLEEPQNTPLVGDEMTLVGFGLTGGNCSQPSTGKQSLLLDIVKSNYAAIVFDDPNKHTCPADSGGPIINGSGRVVGVCSWGDFDHESTYRPTGFSYNWIVGLARPGWDSCGWYPVEQAGINSHQPGPDWCPSGSFLVGFDLDGDRDVSAHDAPVIGQANCCALQGASAPWDSCGWYPVEQAGIRSHQPAPAWCPVGSYLTQFDLDAENQGSANDSPVVGQARCCRPAGYALADWGSTYWMPVEVEGVNSHAAGDPWCLDGAVMTQFDLDGDPGSDDHDAPVVGQAKCSRPGG